MAGSANRSHSGRHQSSAANTSKLYDLLGLCRSATAAEIRSAYRKLAKIHHPDKGGDPEKFKELTHALEVLSDTEKRVKYDRWGDYWSDVDHTPPDYGNQSSGLFDPGRFCRPPARRTEDVVHNINVTLEQLYTGPTIKVAGNREVRIPKGALDGHRVVLPGNAETGDVIFVLHQEEHRDFKRKGADLFVEQKISLVEALCGLELELTHLDGRKLFVKAAPGEVVRPLARGFDPLADADDKLEWEVFQDCDCESIEDVAQADADEAETAKILCDTQLKDQGHNIGAFVIQDGKAHFKQAEREEVWAAKKPKEGATLYVPADPAASSKRRCLKAVRGAGMPTLKNPRFRGNLFLVLDIEFPDMLSPESQSKIRELLPPPLHSLSLHYDQIVEVCDLEDIDPVQSHNANKANMAAGADSYEEQEDVPRGGGTTPAGGEQVQCAQQ